METSRRTNLFLIELSFAIFFFILTSVICLQVFAKSHLLNQRSKQLNFTNEVVQNEIEVFYAHTPVSCVKMETLFFSEDFEPVSASHNAYYVLTRQYSYDAFYQYLELTFSINHDTPETLYQIKVKVFMSESEVAHE